MTAFYVTAYAKGVLQARYLIRALDESDAEILFLRQCPECRGMAIIVEGTWK
jgi:hypothetical protein